MNKRLNDSPTLNHTQYFDTAVHHLSNSTVNIQDEYTNHGNVSKTIDETNKILTVTEIKNEPSIDLSDWEFDDVTIKKEPGSSYSEYDEDSTSDVTGQYVNPVVTNTIVKEEIMIECDVEVFEVGFD